MDSRSPRLPATTTSPSEAYRMLHLMQYRSLLAAAAGRAAALADVAAAGRAHLGAAGQAQRGVRHPALPRLDYLHRAPGTRPEGTPGPGLRRSLPPGGGQVLPGNGLGEFLGVGLVGQGRRVVLAAVQARTPLGR